MEYEIKSINSKPAAKVLAVTFLILAIVFGLVVWLLAWWRPATVTQPELSALLMWPLVLAVAGYISIRLFCGIYNRLAEKWGGMRFDLVEIHSPFNPKWKP